MAEASPSAMDNPRNIAILADIKKSLDEVCKEINWEDPPTGEEFLERYKTDMHAFVMKHIPTAHITESINKTGWPDLAVLYFLADQGCELNSIHDLKEITMNWSYDEETREIKMALLPIFDKPQRRIIIEIEVKKEGTADDE